MGQAGQEISGIAGQDGADLVGLINLCRSMYKSTPALAQKAIFRKSKF
jgi:hypothetical protein